MMPVPQWTVQTPHGTRRAVFEDQGKAFVDAARNATTDAPSAVRGPDGVTYLVLRHSDLVEVTTRYRLVGTTRRVVEL